MAVVDQLIPRDTWIFVGDGRKALFFRNEGNVNEVKLKTEQVFINPERGRTRELGTDRPGRTRQRMASEVSAMEQADWHEIAEERFAAEIGEVVQALCRKGTIKRLVLVAPPKTLADLRKSLPESLHSAIVAEVNKDLTKHPVDQIERLLNTY